MIESLLDGAPIYQLEPNDITLVMSGEPNISDSKDIWTFCLYWVGEDDGFPGADSCPHIEDVGFHYMDDESTNFRLLCQFDIPAEEGSN